MPSNAATTVAAEPARAAAAHTLFIAGSWGPAASGSSFESTNPATGTSIGAISEGGRADASRAIEAAARAAAAWGRT